MTQQKLDPARPIVLEDGTMDIAFREVQSLHSNNLPIIGTGNPEGVVTAAQYSLFIDEAIPLSPVTYRKMLPILDEDRSKGWAQINA